MSENFNQNEQSLLNEDNNKSNNESSLLNNNQSYQRQSLQRNKQLNETKDFILRFQKEKMLQNYNALTDKFLVNFFQNENIRNNLLNINEKNEILETRQPIPKVNIKLDPIQQRQDISHIVYKNLSTNKSSEPSKLFDLNNQKQYYYKKLPPLKNTKAIIEGTLPDLYLRTHFQEFAQKYLQKMDSQQKKSQSASKVELQKLFLKHYKSKHKKFKVQQPLFVTYNKLKAKINNQPFNEKAFIAQHRKGDEIANKNQKNFYNGNNNNTENYEKDEYDDEEFEKDDYQKDSMEEDEEKEQQSDGIQEEESKEKDQMNEEINEKADDVEYQSDEFDNEGPEELEMQDEEQSYQKNQDNSQIKEDKTVKQQELTKQENEVSEEFEEVELITEQ